MSEVWVQAVGVVYAEKNGITKRYIEGDWIPPGMLGRQRIRELIATNQIRILSPGTLRDIQELTDCAIYLRGTILDSTRERLATQHPGVPILSWTGYPAAEIGRFLLWDMSAPLRHELIVIGLGLLTKWQFASPLLSYDTLALNVGTEAERAETKRVIHDLRIPVYNPKVVFCRQGEETRKLFSLWDDGSELSFLRAIYQARALTMALPPSWVL